MIAKNQDRRRTLKADFSQIVNQLSIRERKNLNSDWSV